MSAERYHASQRKLSQNTLLDWETLQQILVLLDLDAAEVSELRIFTNEDQQLMVYAQGEQ